MFHLETLRHRKAALLVDNCHAHVVAEGLTQTTVRFLPPHTTSVLQPCDMGIICTLKVYCRHGITGMNMTILDAM